MPSTHGKIFGSRCIFQSFLVRKMRKNKQSIQKQALRIGSENDKNSVIQGDGDFGKKYFSLYLFSEKSSQYKTYVLKKFLIFDAFEHARWQKTFNIGIKFIIFHPQKLILLDFWWNEKITTTLHNYVMCTHWAQG